MAKRKRLSPARMTDPAPETKSALPRTGLASRPPIADVAHDAAASAALSEVAAELTAARQEERLIQRLPLDAIDAEHLVRDRAILTQEDLDVLAESLAQRGQQTAIEVTDLGNGRYGLISGFRRYVALQMNALKAEKPGSILAIVRHPEDAAEAYQAMVEENEIRAGLSFYERGRIVARATDEGVFRTDRLALAALFAAVPRARRSKIGTFVTVVRALDDVLRFPTFLTEKQGLALARRLAEDPSLPRTLSLAFAASPPQTAAAEAALLAQILAGNATPDSPGAKPEVDEVMPLRPGLDMVRRKDCTITLKGQMTQDDDFVARLQEALKSL